MVPAPEATVVVPTFNRADRLERVLAGLEAQDGDLDRFEVVVVSDGSTDRTSEVLSNYAGPLRLRYAMQENRGPASARNHAIDLARADLIVFLDDDVVPQPPLVSEHLAAHWEASERLVAIGPMLNPSDHQPSLFVRWEQAMLYKQYEAMGRGDWAPTYRQFYTGNASLRRRFVLDAGGFDERFKRAEDIELAARLNSREAIFRFVPEATAYHYAERSYQSWMAIASAYGSNDVTFEAERTMSGQLAAVAREFHRRHPLLRFLTAATAGRPSANRALGRPLLLTALAADRFGSDRLCNAALSALFNVTYYQGVASALGSRQAFLEMMAEARAAADF